MSEFKITYKVNQTDSFYQCRIISGRSGQEAMQKLRDDLGGWYWSIKDITVQCKGTTAKGEPCQRFSLDQYCHNHRGES